MSDRSFKRIAVGLLCALLVWTASSDSAALEAEGASVAAAREAADSDEQIRALLEKSLNIAEIDKEIGRIAARRDEAAGRIAALGGSIEASEAELAVRRDQAGAVLRAYYTGERDLLLAALLSADSLNALFAMADYFEAMLSHDKFTLDRYAKQQDEWKRSEERRVGKECRL